MFRIRLVQLRKSRNITQSKLAELLGLNRASIGKYEGKQGILPTMETLILLADFFGVSTDYLLGRTNSLLPEPLSCSKLALNETDINFFNNYKALERDDKNILCKICSRLLVIKDPATLNISEVFSDDEKDIALKYSRLDDMDKGEVRGTVKTLLNQEKYQNK